VSTKKTEYPDDTRARAEAKFRKQEHAKVESEKVWTERAAAAEAGEKHRAKLKGLRLARDAEEKAGPDKEDPRMVKAKGKGKPKTRT
jgi:hypothetical protein